MNTESPKPAVTVGTMQTLQGAVERIILYSRFILVIFYVGLAVALAAFAVNFVAKLVVVIPATMNMDETGILMAMLVLIDKALVASLIVMVMLSSYENFVGRFEDGIREDSPTWLGRLDPGSLKIKVAATIIAISSINLLQSFLTAPQQSDRDLMWKAVIHGVFLASALCLALLDRITNQKTKAFSA
jgi:uncharacterized protein (TIGR00645 family)